MVKVKLTKFYNCLKQFSPTSLVGEHIVDKSFTDEIVCEVHFLIWMESILFIETIVIDIVE